MVGLLISWPLVVCACVKPRPHPPPPSPPKPNLLWLVFEFILVQSALLFFCCTAFCRVSSLGADSRLRVSALPPIFSSFLSEDIICFICERDIDLKGMSSLSSAQARARLLPLLDESIPTKKVWICLGCLLLVILSNQRARERGGGRGACFMAMVSMFFLLKPS